VGRAANSGNQTTLCLTPMHAEAGLIKSMIANVHAAIQHVKAAAEQLPKPDRWQAMPAYICQRIVDRRCREARVRGAIGEGQERLQVQSSRAMLAQEAAGPDGPVPRSTDPYLPGQSTQDMPPPKRPGLRAPTATQE